MRARNTLLLSWCSMKGEYEGEALALLWNIEHVLPLDAMNEALKCVCV